jgi:CRISPR-associated protein Cas1
MKVPLYLNKQGSILKHSDQVLLIEFNKETLLKVPIMYVDRILVFGNVQINTQTISLVLKSGIDISFLSYGGKLRGTLSAVKSKNVFLRLTQFERFKDEEYKTLLIRETVLTKLNNQVEVIKKYKYSYPELDLHEQIDNISETMLKLDQTHDTEVLRGYEGIASKFYFEFFRKSVKSDLSFEKRTHYPSTDPINAMLSLGYVMLTNEISSLLESASFDPYIGFYHGIRYGRESLALDLVEEFRHPLVDMFVLKLINRKEFVKDDFEIRSNGGCYFLEDKCKEFFTKYENNMNQIVKKDDNNKTWRDIVRLQINKFEEAVMSKIKYEGFRF